MITNEDKTVKSVHNPKEPSDTVNGPEQESSTQNGRLGVHVHNEIPKKKKWFVKNFFYQMTYCNSVSVSKVLLIVFLSMIKLCVILYCIISAIKKNKKLKKKNFFREGRHLSG